ncbi:MAG: hypothetical protein AAGG08_19120, partial [Actinomycetota bacterium]
MREQRHPWILASGLTLLLAACGNTGGSGSEASQASTMDISVVSNGFGELLPHTTFRLGADDEPTGEIIQIRATEDLLGNVRENNPVRSTPLTPATASLPNGESGNHFIYATFTLPLDIDSVLDDTPGGQANFGAAGPITVVALDPATGNSIPIEGRYFVDGQTYFGSPQGFPPTIPLETWVELDDDG